MEQITKVDGKFYYGIKQCYNADDAYCRFRDSYHDSIGRVAFKRLSRLGSRRERVHGYGFVFRDNGGDPGRYSGTVRVRLLGLLCGSYCRMLGGWDIPGGMDDEQFEPWLDWAFSSGSGALKLYRTINKRKSLK